MHEYQDRASVTQGGSPVPLRANPALKTGTAAPQPAYSGKPTLLDHRTAVNAGGTNSWRTLSPTPARKAPAIWRTTSYTTAFRSGLNDTTTRMGALPQPMVKAQEQEAGRGRSPRKSDGRIAWHNSNPTTIFTSGFLDSSCSLGSSPLPTHMRGPSSPSRDLARTHSRAASPTRTWRPAAATTAFVGGICNKSLNMQTAEDYVPVDKSELAKLEGTLRMVSKAGGTRGGSPMPYERGSPAPARA